MLDDRKRITSQTIIDIALDQDLPLAEEADTIARVYHKLCLALADQLGRENLNWCGFAQWSSKAVGFNLRLGNHAPFWTKFRSAYRIPRFLGAPVRLIVRWLLGGSYSKGLSIANRSIFLEMGTLYTNLIDGDLAFKPASTASFASHRLIGPANDKLLETAARMLRQAKDRPEDNDELILGASVALSAYEQARAQPALEFVFYRPARWLMRVSWRMPYYLITRQSFRRYEIYTECHDKQPWLVRRTEARFVRLYARVLSLDTPLGPIWLARTLERPSDHPTPLLDATFKPEIAELISRFRPKDEGRANKGVSDWLDYSERMRFIVSYFMMYQNVSEMFNAPFPEKKSPRLRCLLRNTPGKLRQVLRIPRIIDPAIDQLTDLNIDPEPRPLNGPTPGDDTGTPTRPLCRSQLSALELSTFTSTDRRPTEQQPNSSPVAVMADSIPLDRSALSTTWSDASPTSGL